MDISSILSADTPTAIAPEPHRSAQVEISVGTSPTRIRRIYQKQPLVAYSPLLSSVLGQSPSDTLPPAVRTYFIDREGLTYITLHGGPVEEAFFLIFSDIIERSQLGLSPEEGSFWGTRPLLFLHACYIWKAAQILGVVYVQSDIQRRLAEPGIISVLPSRFDFETVLEFTDNLELPWRIVVEAIGEHLLTRVLYMGYAPLDDEEEAAVWAELFGPQGQGQARGPWRQPDGRYSGIAGLGTAVNTYYTRRKEIFWACQRTIGRPRVPRSARPTTGRGAATFADFPPLPPAPLIPNPPPGPHRWRPLATAPARGPISEAGQGSGATSQAWGESVARAESPVQGWP
ncbi:MAG: hypothetical protein Q9160_005987 [Pyrenula sp. 1 TL-2023]